MRLSTRTLNVPSAPRFFARKTSAIPPVPSLRTISNLAISFGGASGAFMVVRAEGAVYMLASGRPTR